MAIKNSLYQPSVFQSAYNTPQRDGSKKLINYGGSIASNNVASTSNVQSN